MNTIKVSEKMTTRHPFRKKQNTLLFCFDFITKAQICQYVCAERRYSLLHYYLLLQKIMNASLVKSKELKSKNPERFRIRDFLTLYTVIAQQIFCLKIVIFRKTIQFQRVAKCHNDSPVL